MLSITKKIFLLLSLVFVLNITYSQTKSLDQKGISVIELNTAKAMYLEMMKTETFKERDECVKRYSSKLPKGVTMENLVEEDAFRKYIAENLSKSKFKDIDEALEMRQRCAELEDKLYNENLALYKLIQAASADQIRLILAPFFARFHN